MDYASQYLGYEGQFKADYYKVTNLSIIPCDIPWNKGLLNTKDREAYEAFKESPEYKGVDPQDVAAKKKLSEAEKVLPFYEQLAKGVRYKTIDRRVSDRLGGKLPVGTTHIRYEYRFVIGPNIKELERVGNIGLTRWMLDRYEVKYDKDDDLETLLSKYTEKYGANTTVLSYDQWNNSGLKARERREIRLALRPGETKARVLNEGYLVAEPMDEVEIQKYLENQEGYVPEVKAELPKDEPNKEVEDLKKELEEMKEMLKTMKSAEKGEEQTEEVVEETKSVKGKTNAKSKASKV